MSASPTRVGARTPAGVPPEVRRLLECGELSTANFMEQIALDLDVLLRSELPGVGKGPSLSHLPLKARLRCAAARLAAVVQPSQIFRSVELKCDTVRAIGALAIGTNPSIEPAARLTLLEPFADDPHFAVREWAWIGLRDELGDSVVDLLPDLTRWSHAEAARLRRFASEITRPRGVWSRHLRALRVEPALAVDLLTPLANDPDRYVQTSVGNWLNDASRDHPEWVRSTCQSWLAQTSATPATSWICRHGQRSLDRPRTSSR